LKRILAPKTVAESVRLKVQSLMKKENRGKIDAKDEGAFRMR
jgi:hypothetical protein